MKITKHLILTAILILASLAGTASAQKGEKCLGIAGGFASYNTSGFTDVYFQYSFSKHVRIAPEIGYIFRNNNKSGFQASIDMHFPVAIAKAVNIYPLAGITFNNWNYASDDNSVSRGGFDVGMGFDIYFTPHLKMTIQGKYSLMKDVHGAFAGVGLGYIF